MSPTDLRLLIVLANQGGSDADPALKPAFARLILHLLHAQAGERAEVVHNVQLAQPRPVSIGRASDEGSPLVICSPHERTSPGLVVGVVVRSLHERLTRIWPRAAGWGSPDAHLTMALRCAAHGVRRR